MRALAALLVAVAALGLAGAAVAAPSARTAAAPIALAFKPLADGPVVKVKWPYQLTATRAGKPVKGTLTVMLLDPLKQPHQVMDDHEKPIKNRPFTGVFTDKILFPVQAQGFPLVLVFTVKSGAQKQVLELQVQPK